MIILRIKKKIECFFERCIKKIIKIKQWSKGAHVAPNSVVGP